ncbi:Cell fate regulator YlbF, YheA/YmcA/DUF963 family (controls sporulation, competence, biofilm development) [Seinonella peptonophila]|uniref:Cell fate regulator YlbF, YheA/YmcA/DUF963 family (Controls sporulation, competence, biofilm development) n=1 Tax=Seinonella peptonophila TaxID=112248 RepID=A0A1M4W4W9_9BACL|nr:YlbF family regulator [Seinonella peptonophila]SHE76190.1 Cell fate regulator YlbF, YheA/YmcA/DUF963 family (controls sporulation, competence, biofilm development) [Seinonella peptonophila]
MYNINIQSMQTGFFMANPYEQAKQLVEALQSSPEYQQLRQIQDQIEKNETLYKMLNSYRSIQVEIQTLNLQGREPGEDIEKKVTQLTKIIEGIPLLNQYLEAEQKFGEIFQDIQQIVMQPVLELYRDLEQD